MRNNINDICIKFNNKMPTKLLLSGGNGEIVITSSIKMSFNFSYSNIDINHLLDDGTKSHMYTINFVRNPAPDVRGEFRYKWDYANPTIYQPDKVFDIDGKLYMCISTGIMKIDPQTIAANHAKRENYNDAISYPCKISDEHRIVNIIVFNDDIYYQLPIYPDCDRSILYRYDTHTHTNIQLARLAYCFSLPIIVTKKHLFLLTLDTDNSRQLQLTKVCKRRVLFHMMLDGNLAYEQDQIVCIKNNVYVFNIYGNKSERKYADSVHIINTSTKTIQIKKILFKMDDVRSSILYSCHVINDIIYLVRLIWNNEGCIETTRFIVQIVDKNLNTLQNFSIVKEITDFMTCKINSIVRVNNEHICWTANHKKYRIESNIVDVHQQFSIKEII